MSAEGITYVGHATVLIELAGTRLLTDPVLRPRVLHIRRHADTPPPEVGEGLDGVLVSHLHHDHLDFPSLRRLPRQAPIVVPRGGARVLRRRGFTRVIELAPGEGTRLGAVEVVATPAAHEGRRYPFGPRVEAIGFDLRAGRRVYFAGDTDLFAGMAELAGGIDVALLPVGGWGPRLGHGHLGPESAATAAAALRPRIAVPIHWGTLLRIGLGHRREEILRAPGREFAARLAELAPAVDVAVLEPGQSLALGNPPRRAADFAE
jgi:L-ascorbate metabolism protein UlaG (beta-lactamase superfamily)